MTAKPWEERVSIPTARGSNHNPSSGSTPFVPSVGLNPHARGNAIDLHSRRRGGDEGRSPNARASGQLAHPSPTATGSMCSSSFNPTPRGSARKSQQWELVGFDLTKSQSPRLGAVIATLHPVVQRSARTLVSIPTARGGKRNADNNRRTNKARRGLNPHASGQRHSQCRDPREGEGRSKNSKSRALHRQRGNRVSIPMSPGARSMVRLFVCEVDQ
jgi:hypothetical protein